MVLIRRSLCSLHTNFGNLYGEIWGLKSYLKISQIPEIEKCKCKMVAIDMTTSQGMLVKKHYKSSLQKKKNNFFIYLGLIHLQHIIIYFQCNIISLELWSQIYTKPFNQYQQELLSFPLTINQLCHNSSIVQYCLVFGQPPPY